MEEEVLACRYKYLFMQNFPDNQRNSWMYCKDNRGGKESELGNVVPITSLDLNILRNFSREYLVFLDKNRHVLASYGP